MTKTNLDSCVDRLAEVTDALRGLIEHCDQIFKAETTHDALKWAKHVLYDGADHQRIDAQIKASIDARDRSLKDGLETALDKIHQSETKAITHLVEDRATGALLGLTDKPPMFCYASSNQIADYLHLGKPDQLSDEGVRISLALLYASREIETYCGRWFKPMEMVRSFEPVGSHITGRLLIVDTDLLSVDFISTPDGNNQLNSDYYILRPVNWPPYFGVSLKQSKNIRWSHWDRPVTIRGRWGYSEVAPDPVMFAAVRLSAHYYRSGFDNLAIPFEIKQMLAPYVRLRVSQYSKV